MDQPSPFPQITPTTNGGSTFDVQRWTLDVLTRLRANRKMHKGRKRMPTSMMPFAFFAAFLFTSEENRRWTRMNADR